MPQTFDGFQLTLSKGQSLHPGLQAPSFPGLFPWNPLVQPHWPLSVPWTPQACSHPEPLHLLPCLKLRPQGSAVLPLPFHSGLCVNVPLEKPSLNSLFSPHPASPYPDLFSTVLITPDILRVHWSVFTACLLPPECKLHKGRNSPDFAQCCVPSAQNDTRLTENIQEMC